MATKTKKTQKAVEEKIAPAYKVAFPPELPANKRGKLSSKLFIMEVADPMGRPKAKDEWKDFREIEKIELKWEFCYKHSLGKYSKFFIELEKGNFYATKCPKCGTVWAMPRPVCANDLTICKWKKLTGKGTLVSYSISEFVPAFMKVKTPYVLAMVKLDGADTLFAHQLLGWKKREDIKTGMRVKVVYKKGPVGHPMQLMHFEPM